MLSGKWRPFCFGLNVLKIIGARHSENEKNPQLADISETQKISKFRGTCKNLSSKAILNSNLLHGTVHHLSQISSECLKFFKS